MKTVMGIDGGGTQTRAVIFNDKGLLLGIGVAESSNPNVVGQKQSISALKIAMTAACDSAEIKLNSMDSVFLGISGLPRVNREVFKKTLTDKLSFTTSQSFAIDHDLHIALTGGLVGEPGIVLVVGTGSACYGLKKDGSRSQSGGWGYLVDDFGSAYWIGLQALAAVAQSADQRAKPTALTHVIKEALELGEINQLISRIYDPSFSRDEIASLAPHVFFTATSGDTTALAIIHRGCEELARMTTTVARKLHWNNAPLKIVITGGVARAKKQFLNPLNAALKNNLPQATLIKPILPPVFGAVLLAYKLINISPSESLIKELKDQAANNMVDFADKV